MQFLGEALVLLGAVLTLLVPARLVSRQQGSPQYGGALGTTR